MQCCTSTPSRHFLFFFFWKLGKVKFVFRISVSLLFICHSRHYTHISGHVVIGYDNPELFWAIKWKNVFISTSELILMVERIVDCGKILLSLSIQDQCAISYFELFLKCMDRDWRHMSHVHCYRLFAKRVVNVLESVSNDVLNWIIKLQWSLDDSHRLFTLMFMDTWDCMEHTRFSLHIWEPSELHRIITLRIGRIARKIWISDGNAKWSYFSVVPLFYKLHKYKFIIVNTRHRSSVCSFVCIWINFDRFAIWA